MMKYQVNCIFNLQVDYCVMVSWTTFKIFMSVYISLTRWPSGRASNPEREVWCSILTQVAMLCP